MMTSHAQQFTHDLTKCVDYSSTEWESAKRRCNFVDVATSEEINAVVTALIDQPISSDTRAQVLLELFLQGIVRRSSEARESIFTNERIALFYRHLGQVCRSRSLLLRLLATSLSSSGVDCFCTLIIDDPPSDLESAAVAFAPFFQRRQQLVSSLFPRLFEGLQHLSVAGLIIDLANFLTREKVVDSHPGSDRKETLATLLGQVARRLDHLEETTKVDSEEAKKNQKKISECVSLVVSLCDSVALIGDKDSIAKLNQVIELKHRRIRTEAAAALVRLGDETGKETLLSMAAEPVTRLRVLAYAEELQLLDEIDEQYLEEPSKAEAELALWLAEPTNMGLAPTNLELIDSQTYYWPGFEEPRTCYLFQFTYQFGNAEYANVGIVGPITHAFDVDLLDLPSADIYALYAGWQTEHDEIIEFDVEQLNPQQFTHVQQLLGLLPEDEFEEVQPLILGSFFGELSVVAKCTRQGTSGILIIDAERVAFRPFGVSRRPLRAEHVHWLYKGKRLLEAFN